MQQGWDQQHAETFVTTADILIPERRAQFATVVDLLPFATGDPFRLIDVGCGEGLLAQAILDRYPKAVCHATDGAQTMLEKAQVLLATYGGRVHLSRHNLHEPDYLSSIVPGPVGAIVSSLAIHHCDDSEKAALYRDAFEKLALPGALIVIDVVKPTSEQGARLYVQAWQAAIQKQSQQLTGSDEQYEELRQIPTLFYHQPEPQEQPATLVDNLSMLAAAGFEQVDCFWKKGGFAVFGGYKIAGT